MRIAKRHVKFVGGDDAEIRVSELPPPLMSDHVDAERSGRARRSLHYIYSSRGYQKKHEYNQDRHCGPREFDRIAAIELGRFAVVVAGAGTKANHAVSKQSPDDHKDHGGDGDHEECDGVDLVRRGGGGIEDAAGRDLGVGIAHAPVLSPRGYWRAEEKRYRHA